jgi:hypothetical protein
MYRIKEVDGFFIAQKLVWFNWLGIDTRDKFLWWGKEMQQKYCLFCSLEKARERIKSYKLQNKKHKVKYYKAT